MKMVHPEYPKATITCACGAIAETRSTRGSFSVEICSACHPVYTGRKQKLMDAAGRIERFRKRYGKGEAATASVPPPSDVAPEAKGE